MKISIPATTYSNEIQAHISANWILIHEPDDVLLFFLLLLNAFMTATFR